MVLLLWSGIGGYLVQKHRLGIAGAEQDARNLAHAFEENVRRTVEAVDTSIRAVRVARARDPEHFEVAAWERDSGRTRELAFQLSVADRDGGVLGSGRALREPRVSIADRSHFLLTRDQPEDTLFISPPVVGRVSGRWSVQFVRKMFDSDGGFDGVVVASLDPGFLSRFYASLDVGRGALILAGPDGTVRAAAPAGLAEPAADLSGTPLLAAAMARAQGTVRMAGKLDGLDRIFSWRHVEPYGLIAIVGLPVAEALDDFRKDLRGCVTIGAVLTALTVAVSAVLARNRRDLIRSQAILRAAVDNISQGLLVVDADRRVPMLNARAAELLGLPEHLTRPGFTFDSLLAWQVDTGEFEGAEAERVRALVRAGGIVHGDSVYVRRRRNGTVLEVRTKALDTGLAVRTFTDITEQENNARVLAKARDAAEAAARARSEFLAVMSHEIRTPLNGVIGVAELLGGMDLGPEQREHVRLIRESGDHLLMLINDILDFSRLEASGIQLEETDFDPRALADGVIAMFRARAGAKGLSLTTDIDGDVPALLNGDPGRLRQILLNLIGNAIKFTDQGFVTLTMTRQAASGDGVRLLCCIADTGIGIAPEAIERIFTAFTQADGSISRRFGGSGLGLAISRRLVERMGGSIGVESEPGAGSTFRFDVVLRPSAAPADAPAASAAPAREAACAPSLRILLAEDNPTNRLVAVRLLERLGHHADAVGNGAEAIAALRGAAYDLVLMDVMMPQTDGLAATRAIRAGQAGNPGIAVVGLTAGSAAENIADCLDAGMDAVTTKPVTLVRLRAAIAEGLAVAGGRAAAAGPEPPCEQMRELVEALGEDAVREIVQTFAEDTRAHLSALREAAESGDTERVYRIAHSVAGAARNVGAAKLAERASMLEQNVGTLGGGQMVAEARAMAAELEAALAVIGTAASDPVTVGEVADPVMAGHNGSERRRHPEML